MVDLERRKALKLASHLGLVGLFATLGLVTSRVALAQRNVLAFEAKNLSELLGALGVVSLDSSDSIQLTAPETAENGAFVPITITSTLARTEQISILVEKNPNTLAANFVLPEGTEGLITARIKMGQTDTVIALVKADGKFYRTSKEVKVTVGGCS